MEVDGRSLSHTKVDRRFSGRMKKLRNLTEVLLDARKVDGS